MPHGTKQEGSQTDPGCAGPDQRVISCRFESCYVVKRHADEQRSYEEDAIA